MITKNRVEKRDTPKEMDVQYNLGKYKTIRVLGEGRYATVYEGKSIDGKIVAIKVTSKYLINKTNPHFIENELEVFKRLSKEKEKCCNLLQYINFCEEKENAFFILEYIDGYTLQRVIFESFNTNKRITNSDKKDILLQIGNGLKYLHKLNIYHCDLKPENILIYNSNGKEMVKICDFGCSISSTSGTVIAKRLRFSGTPGYSTPEVYLDLQLPVKLMDVDTWAYTSILYYSFIGIQPFARANCYHTLKNVREINVTYTNIDQNIKNICEKVFIKETEKRANLDTIIEDIRNLPNCN